MTNRDELQPRDRDIIAIAEKVFDFEANSANLFALDCVYSHELLQFARAVLELPRADNSP